VVDVSGKGIEAGTRSLLLSGAFGGLASAVPAGEFLPAANTYLLRQEWDEGFATAIHLHLCLVTGDFELRKAGHPPAVHLHAGSGRWSTLDSDGAVLGLIPDTEFEVVTGRLDPGDALLMYTDGLVETTRRDIGSGIDKLAGRGQTMFATGFTGGAQAIINELATSNDDGALVLVHRRTGV
jgi:serine phosphatase RsbU (regulator of sigma subunit)